VSRKKRGKPSFQKNKRVLIKKGKLSFPKKRVSKKEGEILLSKKNVSRRKRGKLSFTKNKRVSKKKGKTPFQKKRVSKKKGNTVLSTKKTCVTKKKVKNFPF